MSTNTVPMYSRLGPKLAVRREAVPAHPTKAQSALEYSLFAVFGLTIMLAGVALYATNSASHRRVPNRIAAGIAADRVNVLIMATHRHQRTNLPVTDSLMVLSIKPSTKQSALIGIPRDLWVDLGNYGSRRIGAAPAVGLSSGYPGESAGLTGDTVAKVLEQPLHAFVRIDTADLPKAIDSLGGIDLEVRQSVYEHRMRDRFTVGRHHLNGARAKRYAFSSHVQGRAADRFAREARQYQVAAAVLARAARGSVVERLSSSVQAEQTNLTPADIKLLAGLVGAREPQRVTLAPYMQAREVATFTDKGEVVAPRRGDFTEVQHVAAHLF